MSKFHLAGGLYFERVADAVTIEHPSNDVMVDIEGIASVMAHLSKRGETGETYREALAFLNREPGSHGPGDLVFKQRGQSRGEMG